MHVRAHVNAHMHVYKERGSSGRKGLDDRGRASEWFKGDLERSEDSEERDGGRLCSSERQRK
jgi:hypothetical protein